ncbi:hypothetical protein MHD_05590 [Mannheimia granulomatis]|uniref:Uncharacterized protein n=1 Tax=Mannheimia granulomatis TaxID=85402 RepID=A0A011NAL2_9PAST|nr:hypothetical protein [Mannheimia granulomatis]EXI61647.1 hypothetical protein AK33_08625 [Mannheimia granulomatis]RGE48283.1 hypothetical protein MHD_05590 [Mannheimia granulomatis]
MEQVQAVTNEQVFAKLCEVEQLLRTKSVNEHSRELWGLEEVAAYFGYSKEHTSRSITSMPNFPRAVALDGLRGKGRAYKKWVSGEVVQFCMKWKMKN